MSEPKEEESIKRRPAKPRPLSPLFEDLGFGIFYDRLEKAYLIYQTPETQSERYNEMMRHLKPDYDIFNKVPTVKPGMNEPHFATIIKEPSDMEAKLDLRAAIDGFVAHCKKRGL